MALTKKDKLEVSAMIGRAVMATASGVDSQAIENTAGDSEIKIMHRVSQITIAESLKHDLNPASGTRTAVNIRGEVDGEVINKYLTFPPGDPTILSELKRIQNNPHLYQNVQLQFRVPAGAPEFIILLFVGYDATL